MELKKTRSFVIYGFVIILFSILVSAGYYYSSLQKDYGLRINLAGRQRMLSQIIFKEILLFNLGELTSDNIEKSIKVFTETQDALIYGGDAPDKLDTHIFRKLPENSDKEIIVRLMDVKNEWEPIKNIILNFLKQKDKESFRVIISHDKSLLTKIDNSVYALQLRSEKNTLINRIIIICSFIMLSMLLIINITKKIKDLKEAEEKIKELEKLLPICSNCKKIRTNNDKPMDPDSWTTIEKYLHDKNEMSFTHGICPDCIKKLYPGMIEGMKK